jgi:hypothetical protein
MRRKRRKEKKRRRNKSWVVKDKAGLAGPIAIAVKRLGEGEPGNP